MTKDANITQMETEIAQLEIEQNSSSIQKLDFLTKKFELLLKLKELKIKEGPNTSSSKLTGLANLLSSPLLLAIIAGLLTSLVAPSIIERTREKSALIRQKEEKQDKVTQTQFEIIEKLNTLLWNYHFTAGVVKQDFIIGQLDKDLLIKHKKDYDTVADITFKSLAIEAYRARMYFDDEELYKRLIIIITNVANIDLQIVKLIKSQGGRSDNKTPDTDKGWQNVNKLLEQYRAKIEETLNLLYVKVGKQDESLRSEPNNSFNPTPR